VCAYTDLTHGRVLNAITLPMIPLALFIRLIDPAVGGLEFMYEGLVGAAVCFIVFFIIWVIGTLSGKPLMGGGDVKLMAAVGALMGPYFAGWVLMYSVIIGALMSFWVLFKHGEIWAGMVGSFRRLIWPSHPSEVSDVERRATSRTISFCTAIAVGGMMTLLFYPDLVFFSGGGGAGS
jgi:prepilin peptidase CpaA